MKILAILVLLTLNIFLTPALTPSDSAIIQSSVISYKMVNISTGEVVADLNSKMAATPASVTKLITTASALEMLGPNYKFPTYIETDGYISNDTLVGNLIIRGTGDPTFGSSFCGSKYILDSIVIAIKNKGVNFICGDVIADASCFNRFPVPDKWVWEDIGFNYGAGAYGINIFDNTAIYFFSAGVNGTTSISRVDKDLPDMINTHDISVSRLSKESLLAYCAPYSNKRFFHGSLMPGRKNVPLKVSTSNPPLVAAYHLYKNLIAGGVGITGAPREVILGSSLNCTLSDPIIPTEKGSSPCSGKTPSNEFSFENHTVLDTFFSVPIADIIKVTNFKSNNLYAESIFRHIGLLVANSSASSSNSIDTIRSFWSQKGVNLDFMRIYDGCGLSPQGAIPAASVVDILLYMYNSKNYSYFLSSLPLAGKEGTVYKFLVNTPLREKVNVKSGSLSGARAYAGYIFNNGNKYAFAIIFNNFSSPNKEVNKIIEEWLVRDAK